MKVVHAFVGLLAVATLVVACGEAKPAQRPSPPALEAVGVVVDELYFDDRTVFKLVDGTVWERRNDQFRFRYQYSARSTLFVSGTDAEGTYVYLIGGSRDIPAECRHAIGWGGREWGDGIEVEGLLWMKAPAFSTSVDPVPVGIEYPTTIRFCLDDRARVIAAVELNAGG